VAAQEQDREAVVLLGRDSRRGLVRDTLLTVAACPVAAPCVDQSAGSCRQQPAPGLVGDTVARPALGRDQESLLDGVLGCVEVGVPARERADDLRRELAQQVLDLGGDVQLAPAVRRKSSISAASEGPSSMI
jgi:hypothetical protein